MGGKLAFAESTNGVQFTRSEGPSLVLYPNFFSRLYLSPIFGHFPNCNPQI